MTAMPPHKCCLQLQRILDQSLESVDALEDLLHEERSALELQDSEKLLAVTTSKTLCVRHLETLETERRSLCTAAGYEASDAGMMDLLKWCDDKSDVAPAWDRLLHSARQCEALNRTNGAIGRIRHEQAMSLLAVLSGGADSSGTLYSSEGQESTRFQQRALARI